jgi:tetratricopeptide (TPR) repeat protein
MQNQIFLLMLLVVTVLLSDANAADQPQGRRWALLVGVNDYANLEDLRYCAADMRDLEKHLVDAGFDKEQVFVVHSGHADSKYQPFRSNIEKQLDMVLGFVEPDDLVLVAFSGHGVLVDGQTYLCPTEADVDRPETLVAVDAVYQKLERCRASLKLLIVDACRNDPRPAGRRSATPKQDLERLGQSFQQPPEGIVLLASCAPGEISMESEEFGRGVFMNYLLDAFTGSADTDKDGRISLGEAAEYAGLKTKLYVARKYNDSQRPYLTGDTTIEALAYAIATRLPLPAIPEVPKPEIRIDPASNFKITQYSEKIRINPRDATAYNKRGMVWYDLGEYDKAIADYTEALRIKPNDAALWNNLANARSNKGDYHTALANFAESLRLDPKDAMVYANRASTWRLMRNYEYAIKDLNYAIHLDPKYAVAYSKRGMNKGMKGDSVNAIRDFSEAIRLDADNPTYRISRAWAHMRRGDIDLAIADCNKAIQLDPTSAYAFNNRAWAWYKKGKYAKTLADADEAIRLDPEFSTPYFNRGEALKRLGKYEDAIIAYHEAIRLDPKFEISFDANAFASLALLCAACPDKRFRDGKQAIELAKKAIELDADDSAEPLEALAAAHAELGSFDEAVEWQTKAIELCLNEKDNAKARERLAGYQAGKPWREPAVVSEGETKGVVNVSATK